MKDTVINSDGLEMRLGGIVYQLLKSYNPENSIKSRYELYADADGTIILETYIMDGFLSSQISPVTVSCYRKIEGEK